MGQEFNNCYDDLLLTGGRRLRKAWQLKLESMKSCADEIERRKRAKKENEDDSNIDESSYDSSNE